VLSVGEVTRQIKDALEGEFPDVLVRGELSNLSRASSGHVYLTLKDDEAQLRAVIWRNVAQRLRFELHDGLEVIAAGPIEVYAARGTYQLVIRDLLPRGMGPLELAFRQPQEKLAREGLFDPACSASPPLLEKNLRKFSGNLYGCARDAPLLKKTIARKLSGSGAEDHASDPANSAGLSR
jgi:exodeoxyribonuclease VII large subunit